jgi:hypothetical protein
MDAGSIRIFQCRVRIRRYRRIIRHGGNHIRSQLISVLLLLVCGHALAAVSPCPVTSGPLTLNCINPRPGGAGISPLLVFFDCTGTTDTSITGNTTTFQDVIYTWNFGDTQASGLGNWLYGARGGYTGKNLSTDGIAAHLYIVPDGAGDKAATAIVTAVDPAGNTATCGLNITAFDPSGTNGFPGTATTCVAASTTPVAGSGGCPSGAAVSTMSSFNTAISSSFGNGKRVLFRCGDTFTGDDVTLTAVKASVGAYGGCQGTQTGQPIFSDTAATGDTQLNISANSGDIRISDIFFNGNGSAGGAVTTQAFVTQNIPYQVTMSNLQETGGSFGYSWTQGAQWGLVGSTLLSGATGIAIFVNSEGSNPATVMGTFPNVNYAALIGDFINGVGAAGGSGAGIETMRTAECRLCVYENNTIENANNVGAVFKMHNANTFQSCGQTGTSCVTCTIGGNFVNTACWTGQFTELVVLADNLFTGNSGGILSDVAPQNGGVDERLRNIVIERNLYSSPTNSCCDALLLFTGANLTIRDNVFYMPANGSIFPQTGAILAQRGSGNAQVNEFSEAYNNTCYAPNTKSGQQCIGFDTSGATFVATANSFAQNNLFFVPTTATGPSVHNTGSGNTVSNNTVTVTNNPGFKNGSGSFSVITDFKPTANFSGATPVPVQADALGVLWGATPDLGAVHH